MSPEVGNRRPRNRPRLDPWAARRPRDRDARASEPDRDRTAIRTGRGPEPEPASWHEPAERRWTRCRCSWPRCAATGCCTGPRRRTLSRRIERGDLAAKERLVNSNLRLVISNARSYEGLDLPLLDLIQEGMLGLIRAAEKFDWRKGYKFSHLRHVLDPRVDPAGDRQSGPADPGAGPHRSARAPDRACPGGADRRSSGASPPTRRSPSAAELEVREVHASRDIARVVTSLDRPVGEEEETTLGALLASDATRRSTRRYSSPRATTRCIGRSSGCPRPNAGSWQLRYGIDGDDPTPLREAGGAWGSPPTPCASSSARRSPSSPGAASSSRCARPPESLERRELWRSSVTHT